MVKSSSSRRTGLSSFHKAEDSPNESIKMTTNGALMRNTGEKTQSLVAPLKVPADAPTQPPTCATSWKMC